MLIPIRLFVEYRELTPIQSKDLPASVSNVQALEMVADKWNR